MRNKISIVVFVMGLTLFIAGLVRVSLAAEGSMPQENDKCTERGRVKNGLPCTGNFTKDVPLQGRKIFCPGPEFSPKERWHCPSRWRRIFGAGDCGFGGIGATGECKAATGLSQLLFIELTGECGAIEPDCQPGAPTGEAGSIDDCVCTFET